jgi:hypothetical protein
MRRDRGNSNPFEMPQDRAKQFMFVRNVAAAHRAHVRNRNMQSRQEWARLRREILENR